jgi:glycolate oxidase iron-sulfur subunit
MMKDIEQGRAPVDAFLAEHLYACLGCRACETACPSGVPFGRLLEYGRAQVEAHGELTPVRRRWRLFRALATERILPSRALTRLALWPARMLQRFPGLRRFASSLPLPARFRTMLDMIPDAPSPSPPLPESVPAVGERRARVGLFLGCVMNELFEHVHAATVRVLRRQGYEVAVPAAQWCCGALNVHAGERKHARAMARAVIDAFAGAGVELIAVNSAGCGAALKEYGELLRDDPEYSGRARAFAASVRDVSELLLPFSTSEAGASPLPAGAAKVVTYQDACHLAHAQGVRDAPRAILRGLPGIQLVEMSNPDRCCGAAGLNALTHPEMAAALLEEKLANAAATGAGTIVVCNPGCHMHLRAGIARRGMAVRIRHVVELLDEAYAASARSPITQ